VRRRVLPSAALALAVVLAVAGCGGSGGGSGPTSPPPPTPGITFTAAGSAAAPGISLVAGAASTASRLVLEVRATGVRDLYGVAFDLQYPGGVLTYASSSNAGSILAGGAFQVSPMTGDLVVGESLLGGVRGVAGDGLLLTLEFQPAASGSGTFSFARNTAFDSAGRPITGVSWIAGSVQVIR
jgi:hypothetical protein